MTQKKFALKNPKISFSYFFRDLKKYELNFFKRDLISAASVALLSIPQSIAYALLAGLSPVAGLFSSIFGTIFTGVLGSSRYLIASPSTGVAILIQTVLSEVLINFYPDISGAAKEALTLQILGLIVFMIGLIQILAGLFNLEKLLQFVSRPVVLGYLFGVALAIFISQVFYVFGIGQHLSGSSFFHKTLQLILHVKEINLATVVLSLGCILTLLFLRKKFPKSPNAFLILLGGSFIAFFWNFLETTKLPFLSHMNNLGDIGLATWPKFSLFSWTLDISLIPHLFFPALAIALLSMLEIFSVTRSLAAKSGAESQLNQEFFAVGVSNFLLSFLQSVMPVSASLSRSFLNFEARSKTRFSAIFSGLFVALFLYLAWPLASHVPLSVLASLLIVIVFSLQDWKQIRLCFKATKGDAIVFVLTVFCCLILRLDLAFYAGIALSIAYFLRKASNFHLVEYAFDTKGRLVVVFPKMSAEREVRIIGIGGEMFFAAVDVFQNTLQTIANDPNVKSIVLRLSGVYHIDASMCLALLGLHEYLKTSNRHLILSGISEEVLKTLARADLIEKLGKENLFITDEARPQYSTWKACERAMELIYPKKESAL